MPQDKASSGGVGEKSARRPATHTHSPRIWIAEYAMGPYHTHTFAMSMAAIPIAQRCMGLKAPELRKTKAVAPHGFPLMQQEEECHTTGDSRDGGGRPPIR